MSDDSALLPLQQTHESIVRIKQTLDPFLSILKNYHKKCNKTNSTNKNENLDSSHFGIQPLSNLVEYYKVIEAEAAVALAIGTLRFMAFRLKGQERGKKKNDPLRMELKKMKEMLSQVQALRRKEDEDINEKDACLSQSNQPDDKGSKESTSPPPSKRKRMVDHDENDVENEDDFKAAAVSKKTNMKTRPGLKKRRKK